MVGVSTVARHPGLAQRVTGSVAQQSTPTAATAAETQLTWTTSERKTVQVCRAGLLHKQQPHSLQAKQARWS